MLLKKNYQNFYRADYNNNSKLKENLERGTNEKIIWRYKADITL